MIEYYNLTDTQDSEVEALVDKAGLSYHEARHLLGYSALVDSSHTVSSTVPVKPSTNPIKVSQRAATAPDAADHASLGEYPDDPTPYIR